MQPTTISSTHIKIKIDKISIILSNTVDDDVTTLSLDTIRYDTIEGIIVDSKAEYTA